jgi:TrkA domain protein
MTLYETTIPGVGRKFEIDCGTETLVALVHHDGKRELFRDGDGRHERLASLSDREARQLGSVLAGTYYQPVQLDDLEVPLGEAIIEWVRIDDDSRLADTALGDATVWRETGATIIAVQRGRETVPSPDPEFVVEPGDTVVALGTRDELTALDRLLGGR